MEEIVLQTLMGHTDYQTTKKFYIKVTMKRIKQEMQRVAKAS